MEERSPVNEIVLVPQSPAPEVQKILAEPPITIEEAEAAAGEAGISVIRIKRLKASSTVGKFLEQLGATKIGRTVVLTAQEHVESGIQQCDELLSKVDPESFGVEAMIEVIKIKQAYTELLMKSGVAQMRTDEKVASVVQNNQPLRMPFPPGTEIAIKTGGE